MFGGGLSAKEHIHIIGDWMPRPTALDSLPADA
jgi:hypothetical protein